MRGGCRHHGQQPPSRRRRAKRGRTAGALGRRLAVVWRQQGGGRGLGRAAVTMVKGKTRGTMRGARAVRGSCRHPAAAACPRLPPNHERSESFDGMSDGGGWPQRSEANRRRSERGQGGGSREAAAGRRAWPRASGGRGRDGRPKRPTRRMGARGATNFNIMRIMRSVATHNRYGVMLKFSRTEGGFLPDNRSKV